MQAAWTYWIENTGNITGTVTMALDPTQSYVIEGFFTKKNGGDYAHVYISELCTQISSDQIDCGIRDEPSSGIVSFLSSAVSVTVGLTTTGGNHRAEGVIYQL
jgi:hypothetical protein